MSSDTIENLYAIWGTDKTNVFAVGAAETMVHFNGSVWTEVHALAAGATLRAVWGSRAGDVWAAGTGGRVLRVSGVGQWNASDPATR